MKGTVLHHYKEKLLMTISSLIDLTAFFYLLKEIDPKRYYHTGARVDQGVMAIKGFSTLLRAPELESYNQIHFSVIPTTFFWRGRLLLSKGILFVYYNPR